MNQILLVGRLVRNPEMVYLENGRGMCKFVVAVERNFKNEKGEREVDFISCVMWGKRAESFSTYMTKGALCGLVGSVRSTRVEKNGQTRYYTNVQCTDFYFMESKSIMDGRRSKQHAEVEAKASRQDETVEISEEELPF